MNDHKWIKILFAGYLIGLLHTVPIGVFWYFDRINSADIGCKLSQTNSKYSEFAKKFWNCK